MTDGMTVGMTDGTTCRHMAWLIVVVVKLEARANFFSPLFRENTENGAWIGDIN